MLSVVTEVTYKSDKQRLSQQVDLYQVIPNIPAWPLR